MRRSAFTLMELLIVISIIIILMGMVFVGISLAKKKAQFARTESLIMQMRAALENYRQVQGHYPASGPDWDPLFQDNGTPPVIREIADIDWSRVNQQLVIELNRVGESFPSPLLDAWKNPIRYRPSRYYPYSSSASNFLDKEDPPNPDGFQLWSRGEKNQADQNPSDSSYDDITNWPKP